jgi:hypothetical protein
MNLAALQAGQLVLEARKPYKIVYMIELDYL